MTAQMVASSASFANTRSTVRLSENKSAAWSILYTKLSKHLHRKPPQRRAASGGWMGMLLSSPQDSLVQVPGRDHATAVHNLMESQRNTPAVFFYFGARTSHATSAQRGAYPQPPRRLCSRFLVGHVVAYTCPPHAPPRYT